MKKIVVIVNDYIDYINIELFLYEYDLFKSNLIERCVFNLSDDNMDTIKEELLVKLAGEEFNKAQSVVGLFSPFFFLESLTMPKLNFLEESKASSLKLDKLYKNFDENFFYIRDKYTSNKTRKHQIIAIRKPIYNKFLDLFSGISLNVDKVFFLPLVLAEYVSKKRIFPKDKVGLFINIDRTSTSIIISKGPNLIDYKVLDYGILSLHDLLSNPKDNTDKTNTSTLLNDFITRFEKEIKNMCYLDNESISDIYLYSDYGVDKSLKTLLENALGVSLKVPSKGVTQPNFHLISSCLLKSQSSFFPVKLNEKKR